MPILHSSSPTQQHLLLQRRQVGGPSGTSIRLEATDQLVSDLVLQKPGKLTDAEVALMRQHVAIGCHILEGGSSDLIRIASLIAGAHHERWDGKGYPKGLTREQMSVQARVMGIADIFEALTASDRPYKPGKTLSESLTILGRMKLDHHVDPDLFDVFLREKVYLEYAERFLPAEQIDDVDWTRIPGVSPEL